MTNSGVQYADKGHVDWIKAGLSIYGYTPAGAGMKWDVATGASAAVAGVKAFLSATGSFVYSQIHDHYPSHSADSSASADYSSDDYFSHSSYEFSNYSGGHDYSLSDGGGYDYGYSESSTFDYKDIY